jgi:uncharacterized membrane protein
VLLHFPVVLLSLIPLVVGVSLLPFGKIWKPTIPYFVHLGTLSAIPTALFGYFLIDAKDTISNGLEWHERLGYIVTAFMVIFSLLLLIKKPNFNERAPIWVMALAVLAAGLVTAAAHLGGESVHGSLLVIFGQSDF